VKPPAYSVGSGIPLVGVNVFGANVPTQRNWGGGGRGGGGGGGSPSTTRQLHNTQPLGDNAVKMMDDLNYDRGKMLTSGGLGTGDREAQEVQRRGGWDSYNINKQRNDPYGTYNIMGK